MAECLTKIIYVKSMAREAPIDIQNGQSDRRSADKKRSFFDEGDLEGVDLRQWMRSSCLRLNKALKADKMTETYLSGSTGVLVLVFRKRIITANVGDSGAILIKRDEQNGYQAVKLTRELNPNIESEKDRIIEFGGEIRQYECKF